MNEDIKEAVKKCIELYNDAVAECIDAVLCFGGCTEREDVKKAQIELNSNNYDIVICNFKNNNAKTFVYLSDINGKFIKGYLVEFDFEKCNITKELVKGKVRFEEIIKNV